MRDQIAVGGRVHPGKSRGWQTEVRTNGPRATPWICFFTGASAHANDLNWAVPEPGLAVAVRDFDEDIRPGLAGVHAAPGNSSVTSYGVEVHREFFDRLEVRHS